TKPLPVKRSPASLVGPANGGKREGDRDQSNQDPNGREDRGSVTETFDRETSEERAKRNRGPSKHLGDAHDASEQFIRGDCLSQARCVDVEQAGKAVYERPQDQPLPVAVCEG